MGTRNRIFEHCRICSPVKVQVQKYMTASVGNDSINSETNVIVETCLCMKKQVNSKKINVCCVFWHLQYPSTPEMTDQTECCEIIGGNHLYQASLKWLGPEKKHS